MISKSLIETLYDEVKEKKLESEHREHLEIKFDKFPAPKCLSIILFPHEYERFEQVSALEGDYIIYSTFNFFNSFDTFLIDNQKFEKYKNYFEREPLNLFRQEVEKIKEMYIKNEKIYIIEKGEEYHIMVLLNSIYFCNKNLNYDQIRNAVNFFLEIFQDKLKNPNDFVWHKIPLWPDEKANQ